LRVDILANSPKPTPGRFDSSQNQEHVVSDTEFKPKPLTAKERMTLNLATTAVVLAVLVMGGVMLHFHTDPPSAFQASAPAAPKS
jgi:hypothetical protein